MSITEQLVNSVCKSVKKSLRLLSKLPLLIEPEVLQQVHRNLPLVLSWATRIQSTGSHKIFYKINLNIIFPSTLKYTKFSLFSTVFLQKTLYVFVFYPSAPSAPHISSSSIPSCLNYVTKNKIMRRISKCSHFPCRFLALPSPLTSPTCL